jgi:lipoic acid synthetase/lipoate-protein ligase A
MEHIILPDRQGRPLTFYLAMEEYVAAAFGRGFFVWSVAPTVIIGRNQDLEAEVNLQYCREHGVNIVRRKSGGGCVYADRGNLMLSYVTPDRGVDKVFGDFLGQLSSFLRSLGLNAVTTAHNDVLVDGFKVSGNAFFSLPSCSIVHGTLLHSVDMDALARAITPSAEKLGKHGVQSVRQRVSNLVDLGLELGTDGLEAALIPAFCDSERILGASDIQSVKDIEKSYTEPAFILGKAR